jgi:hypothetical protein
MSMESMSILQLKLLCCDVTLRDVFRSILTSIFKMVEVVSQINEVRDVLRTTGGFDSHNWMVITCPKNLIRVH